MQETKKENGITLIALVTTILVLLILASISIGTILGDGGLIENANQAKEQTEIANEKEVVDRAVVQAMGKNKRGNLVKNELQNELDIITGNGETEVTIDTADYGYFVKFINSGRIYKVSRDGDVEYLGKEEELLTQANIIADPESNTTPKLVQTINLTVETPIDIGNVDFMLVCAWNQDKNTPPEDSEFQVAQLEGEGRRRTTTVESSCSVGGDYYLWVRVVVGDIEKEECFGPYAIKDHSTLLATNTETQSTSTFLGMPIERGLIQNIEIKNSLVGTGHSLGDGNTYDITDGNKGKYLGWYEQNENGYYDVTIAGEGGIVANSNSSCLFANIGYGITDQVVTITGLEYLDTGLVTSMNKIFNNARVESLDLNSFNTSNVKNMAEMFRNCSNIVKLDLESFNTDNVTNMWGMFYKCSKLEILNISSFNTDKVNTMEGMFRECEKLITLDLSGFETKNVTSMSQLFFKCTELEILKLNKFNTEMVTNTSSMFYSCSSLTSLNLKNFDTSNVTNMNNIFTGCSSLTQLDVSNFNTNNVTNMASMFSGCSCLTQLDVSNFDTSNVTNMNSMFNGCSSLTQLDVSNFDTSNVMQMTAMFQNCSALTNLNVSNFNTNNVTNMASMFSGCSCLTQLNLSGFDTSNVTNMSNMFYRCSNLTQLDLSNFDTSNVTNMNYMFNGCSSLTQLDLSNFDTSNVKDMISMFYSCSSLTQLDLSNFDTSNVTTMKSMFNGCLNLTQLNLSNFNTNNVTDWTGMFSGTSTNIEIITNTETEAWLRENFSNLTNIHQ